MHKMYCIKKRCKLVTIFLRKRARLIQFRVFFWIKLFEPLLTVITIMVSSMIKTVIVFADSKLIISSIKLLGVFNKNLKNMLII